MNIAGFQKLTLLDFPGYTACTLFTSGCNFRCPFCHNSDLLTACESIIGEEEFFAFLQSRKGKLDGVCISGGEPLLQPDLIPFIQKIRALGFLVKLDTNGSNYERLNEIVQNKLVDYIAMDIKNVLAKYLLSSGVNIEAESVEKSVNLIKNSGISHEFRTTVVKELNKKEDFFEIAKMLLGCDAYYLQTYRHCDKVLKDGYSAYTEDEMKSILQIVKNAGLERVYLRGI